MPKRAKRSSSGDDGGRSVTQRASSASTASTEAEDGLVYADPYGDTFQPEEIVESDDALARLARLTGAAEAAAAARGGGVATSTGGMTVSMSGGGGGGGGAMEAEDEALAFVDGEGEEDEAERGRVEKGAIWNPATQPLGEDETLDYDSSAYLLYHAMQVQWPCLSFDVLSDQLGGLRTKFPMSMYLVAGTQAPATHAAENKLTVMKLSELNRTEHDEDSENEDWDDVDDDPLLASQSVAHPGAVNRVRSMPQAPHVVATWAAEPAAVHLWDASELIERVDGGAMGGPQTRTLPGAAADATASRPFFSFTEHADEGYAMDWSPVAAGRFATGDCAGQLRVWNMRDGAMDWAVDAPFRAGHTSSVEDVQWSPTEPTVLASCGADAHVRIWDVREPSHPMISVKAHECDVNVLSWNRLVSYLLVSGADDGSFKVWDLRKFQEPDAALANFTWHRGPITSISWSLHDESTICAASADNTITWWDMSCEDDGDRAEIDFGAEKVEVPPQLLFVHQGQTDIKELRFHPQLPGVCMSTAGSGFNFWKPANVHNQEHVGTAQGGEAWDAGR